MLHGLLGAPPQLTGLVVPHHMRRIVVAVRAQGPAEGGVAEAGTAGEPLSSSGGHGGVSTWHLSDDGRVEFQAQCHSRLFAPQENFRPAVVQKQRHVLGALSVIGYNSTALDGRERILGYASCFINTVHGPTALLNVSQMPLLPDQETLVWSPRCHELYAKILCSFPEQFSRVLDKDPQLLGRSGARLPARLGALVPQANLIE